MLLGAFLHAEAYPWMKSMVLNYGKMGRVTLDTVAGVSPWWFILGLLVASILGFSALDRWEKKQNFKKASVTKNF